MTVVGVREGRIQASSHRRRSDARCSLAIAPARSCAGLAHLPASEKRVAAYEEVLGGSQKSISRLVLASSTSTSDRIPQAAACTSLAVVSAVAGLAGLTSTATRVASGAFA